MCTQKIRNCKSLSTIIANRKEKMYSFLKRDESAQFTIPHTKPIVLMILHISFGGVSLKKQKKNVRRSFN